MPLIKSAVYYNHFPYSFRQPDDLEQTPPSQTDNSYILSPTSGQGQGNGNNGVNDDFNEGDHVNEDDPKEDEQGSENKTQGGEHVNEDNIKEDDKQEDNINNDKDVNMDENDTNEN